MNEISRNTGVPAGLMARWGKDEQGSGARNGRLGRSETERTLRGRRERYAACGDDGLRRGTFLRRKVPKSRREKGVPAEGGTPFVGRGAAAE